ncbi:MAG: adenylyl-sulfate kinase [Luteolibacter sp.]
MSHIHPEFHRFLKREDKERLLKQRGSVIWLYGLSGSGKSTIANAVERQLHDQGRFTIILDGDNLRTGLNSNLGFSDEDRAENIRRIAETAKILAQQGVITFVSAITPRAELRQIARDILGTDLFEVFIKASYETCEQRDVKGLYAKAAKGEIPNFTGKQSGFEISDNADLIIDTETTTLEDSASKLLSSITKRISTNH